MLAGGRDGVGWARVSVLFFSKESKSEKKIFFEGVKVREDWLV